MQQKVLIDGAAVRYRTAGKGKPVMLLHGFGENGRVWDGAADFLKEKYKLITPDLPGSGASAMPGDMSIEGMSMVAEAIREAEGLEQFTLIGHSMGGYIALAYAEKYPQRLNGLGLFHSTAYADSEEKKETRRKGIAFIREHGALAFLKTTTPNLFSDDTMKNNAGLADHFMDEIGNFSEEALVSYYEAMIARPDRTQVLRDSKIPILFVIGKADKAVSPEDMLKQSHIPEKAYIHVMQSSAHMGMLEEPGKANKILDEFLSDL